MRGLGFFFRAQGFRLWGLRFTAWIQVSRPEVFGCCRMGLDDAFDDATKAPMRPFGDARILLHRTLSVFADKTVTSNGLVVAIVEKQAG